MGGDDFLPIYLNDHLAGAVGGLQLVRRCASSNRGNDYGDFLSRLAGEIEADLRALEDLMEQLGVAKDRLKMAGSWSAEKLGRLKLNGRLFSYSPYSRMLELELLSLGVEGKACLWRALKHVSATRPRLASFPLDTLLARAETQRAELEEHRLRAAEEAFAAVPAA